jgi:hypothetical protein
MTVIAELLRNAHDQMDEAALVAGLLEDEIRHEILTPLLGASGVLKTAIELEEHRLRWRKLWFYGSRAASTGLKRGGG